MPKPNIAVRAWLKATSPEQAEHAAEAAGTSLEYLRHVAAGRRSMKAELAQKLAHATGIDQRLLCSACGRCPLAN